MPSTIWFPLLGIALCMLLGLVMHFAFKGQRMLSAGLVTGIVGRKGHGKSLFLVHEMLRTVGRKQQCKFCTLRQGEKIAHRVHVASNNAVKLPGKLQQYFIALDPTLSDSAWWAQLETLPHNTLVVIDEMGLRAPAVTSFVLCDEAKAYLAECRKFQHELIWCAQHESRVTIGVKAQTDMMGLCRKELFGFMAVRFCEPENIEKVRKSGQARKDATIATYRYRVTRRLGSAYDTFALIRPGGDEKRLSRLRVLDADESVGAVGAGDREAAG